MMNHMWTEEEIKEMCETKMLSHEKFNEIMDYLWEIPFEFWYALILKNLESLEGRTIIDPEVGGEVYPE